MSAVLFYPGIRASVAQVTGLHVHSVRAAANRGHPQTFWHRVGLQPVAPCVPNEGTAQDVRRLRAEIAAVATKLTSQVQLPPTGEFQDGGRLFVPT